MNWLDGGYFTLEKDEALTLRYRVIVHAGSAQTAGIGRLFEAYEAASETGRDDGRR